ncbi:hypothetical protein BDN72DRAFT_958969 [Pluteus cervinus]|uniref:Uncharacterized protein n=1 Tax=Pluteus cervinus TaxID=181527 RepID=A0ACD3AW75_9AGAR|nr:hypothetical protein BDN72DRAFT_958969 [Pluteus cervinus]
MTTNICCYVLADGLKLLLPSIFLDSTRNTYDLRASIKSTTAPALDYLPASSLVIYKLKKPIPLSGPQNFHSAVAALFPGGEEASGDDLEKLDWAKLSNVFPDLPLGDEIHIVVREPEAPLPTPSLSLKRKRDDPVDISRQLFDLWATPAIQDLPLLKEYLEKPLCDNWKIPLSRFKWEKLLLERAELPNDECYDRDLQLLFRPSEDETADAIWYLLREVITNGPLDPNGTEKSLHEFWDSNILKILVRCLPASSFRGDRDSGLMQLDLGVLLAGVCVFRGEEKRKRFTGKHPRLTLQEKTRWVYDPAPYVLAYHAVGVNITIAAIVPQEGQPHEVRDIITADLSSRRERIKNAIRMIKLCSILQGLQQEIGEPRDATMFLQIRDGNKFIEFGLSQVRKTYGIEDEDAGKESVVHLQAVYSSLVSKGVPNIDRLEKAEIMHPKRGSYVDLEPIGLRTGPESPFDVRNAVVCVLEALKVSHADPPIYHRDIRWPNVMQDREDLSKWFLIDWEDASFAPTKAAKRLNPNEHSPKVFEDNHGGEVDIWGAGWLLVTAPIRDPALRALGKRMMDGHILNAEKGLKEIHDITF